MKFDYFKTGFFTNIMLFIHSYIHTFSSFIAGRDSSTRRKACIQAVSEIWKADRTCCR